MTPIAEFLKKVSIFRDLRPKELEELATHFERRKAQSHERIITEGERSDQFFIIQNGFVNITKGESKPGQAAAFISTLGPSDTFGEASLFHDTQRIANVDASSEVDLLVSDRKRFHAYLDSHPVSAKCILLQVLKQVFQRLEKTSYELQFKRGDGINQDAIDQLFKSSV